MADAENNDMSMDSMGQIMGWMQALTGLAAGFEGAANQRSALKIQQIQNRINRRFAKAEFDRKMTSLFQAHRDLEEQSVQAHAQRQKAYQQQMGSLRVMQAERGMSGTSAAETANQLTRSNLAAEQIMIKNMEKQQRAMMYQREGIADARLAQELGFDMSDANLRSQLQNPVWGQLMAQSGQYALDGLNTYYSFVKDTGRSDDAIE
tara:strand:+ start:121 stop:738 length:618 start_codon:yes stop_codon:yes gene_type:complete